MALPTDQSNNYEGVMSKGMDQKKSQKKEPTKTLKEKRAAKQEKRASKPPCLLPGRRGQVDRLTSRLG